MRSYKRIVEEVKYYRTPMGTFEQHFNAFFNNEVYAQNTSEMELLNNFIGRCTVKLAGCENTALMLPPMSELERFIVPTIYALLQCSPITINALKN